MHREPNTDSAPPVRHARSRRGFGLLRRLKARIDDDRLDIIAAGVAFYGLLSIFPALGALVAVYGLLFDPQQMSRQLGALQGVLPAEALQLLVVRMNDLVGSDRNSLGAGAAIALALALWSASAGTRTLIDALNVAYDVDERRGFFGRAGVALVLTLGAVAGGIVAIAAVVLLPAVLDFLRLPSAVRGLLAYARWPLLAVLAWLALLVVYRFGPNRRHARWSWSDPGAAVAVALWLAGSALFSWYVEHLAHYERTYGAVGAVVILLMWFLLSGYAVLLGAELNAELDHGPDRGSAAPGDPPLDRPDRSPDRASR